MSGQRCTCGYTALDRADLGDHWGEVFIPAGDLAPDGQRHAELVRDGADGSLWECLCGFAAIEREPFDAHLLEAFIPADRVGRDGLAHAPAA